MKGRAAAKNVDDYLAAVTPEKRAALQRLRRTIRSAAPKAEECISYGLPAFRHDGRMLIWFGAAARHCALYPGGIVSKFARDLEAYDVSKGTIRFTPARPLPDALVRKIVRARLREQAQRTT
jgi:uncharacterized protein YdhG (YjbR/CyaY superfamily)